MQHAHSCTNFCYHGNLLFSSPSSMISNILLVLSVEDIKKGYELNLMYLNACWIMQMMHHWW